MSKQGKRKITVELPKSKDLANRPSVFERLGTKKSGVKKIDCRQWVLNGSCVYGKSCKFASTHTLISPSKQRAANKDSEHKRVVKDDPKSRLHSTVVVRSGRSPDGEIDNWDQNDLEYADTDVLEKRRQQLQRELELQMKMDCSKDMRKDKKKTMSSTSSSRSSSSSSVSSSTSDNSSSSSSSGREARRKGKKAKLKRNSSSSSEGNVPSKKKFTKSEPLKRDKSDTKKGIVKKDDRLLKKHDISTKKKPNITKPAIAKKSLSPCKKSGGTPPISSKNLAKAIVKHGKSPPRRERRSISPHSARDRDKDKDRSRDKDREKDKEKEREKDRDRRARSRSTKKARSRSPRQHPSHNKDVKKKESSERSRPVSPKKPMRRDCSVEKHRKRSISRDRGRDHKDRSLEKRKDKHDDKDRHDRKDRGRDRNKESKRDDIKRRGRGDRGLGGRGGSDKGLEKPNKPMERLLPRPEERLAALAAISNRALDIDKNSSTSKDRQDTHSDRGGRKQERLERDRSTKRDRLDSMDRDQGDYDITVDRQYDNERNLDHYDRGDDRYDVNTREDDRSPGYNVQGRDRHYDSGYDMSGPPRGYPEDDDRIYGNRMGDHRADHRADMGFDDHRSHRDRSWEGRSGSMDRDRGYMHPQKEWENEDYRGGDWGRERRWPMHDAQMNEWGDKEPEVDAWHHRGHPGPHRGRMHGKCKDEYGRVMRMDSRGEGNKRRPPRNEPEQITKDTTPAQATPTTVSRPEMEIDEKPIPDDLSEISDDPDDILNREDMVDQIIDDDSQPVLANDEGASKLEGSEKESTQDTSGAADDKESQDREKDDEDVANLDFEEISDGELEEERTRAGLGDALGVDWASLVADVRRREQTSVSSGGARDHWGPQRVLTRLGLSLHLAGKDMVQNILQKNCERLQDTQQVQQSASPDLKDNIEQNGTSVEKTESTTDVTLLHPVAAIQVAEEKRKRQRAVLFGSGCEITRGLSARRDLALRRFLCHLPTVERTGQSRVNPQPSLFHAAKSMLLHSPVTG